MSQKPIPLPEETVLGDRWIIRSVLGQGLFTTTYLAEDLVFEKGTVIKELAPAGSVREPNLELSFPEIGPSAMMRLRHEFLRDPKRLQKLSTSHLPRFLGTVQQYGTAYSAAEQIESVASLKSKLLVEGRLEAGQVHQLMVEVLTTLEDLHAKGILHKNIRPSNILVTPAGEATLTDFGGAREWLRDLRPLEEELNDPWLPPEAAVVGAPRGPSSDIFSLCATAYTVLTGEAPTTPAEQEEGAPLIRLLSVRPDLSPSVAKAIEKGLSALPEERPQSAEELAELLKPEADDQGSEDLISDLDDKIQRLRVFKYDANACPSCGNVLERPKPLAKGICPLCQSGKITPRRIEPRLCPTCRVGVLQPVKSSIPAVFCPDSPLELIEPAGFTLPWKNPQKFACGDDWKMEIVEGDPVVNGQKTSWDTLKRKAGRSDAVQRCDVCAAQFDEMPDGRWKRMTEDTMGDGWTLLYPEEWARIAAGLSPHSGNSACSSCSSDWHVEGESATLLDGGLIDPGEFAEDHLGRMMPFTDIAWLAVGKSSGNSGPVCLKCHTEFDQIGEDELKLVTSLQPMLRRHKGEVNSLIDWHRTAKDLPHTGGEEQLDDKLVQALGLSYRSGDLLFDAKHPDMIWQGQALHLNRDKAVKLLINDEQIQLAGPLKRVTYDIDGLISAFAERDTLVLQIKHAEEPVRIEVDPAVLTIELASGTQELHLDAEDLAARLNDLISRL
jgi:serine/threonine protein kinase